MKRLLYLLIPALLCSCAKDLELEYRELDPIPVIEANLTDKGLDVRITLTSPMAEPMDTVARTDYVATLSNEGNDYRLDVEFDGKHFYSNCEMQPKARIADVKFEWAKLPYDQAAVMTIYIKENPEIPDEGWWIRGFRNGETYLWMYYNDKYAINGLVEASAIVSYQDPMPDDENSLRPGDVLTLTVTSAPPHIMTYLNDLSAHTIAGPTTFSGDFCLGYFLASTPVDTTLTYSPSSF